MVLETNCTRQPEGSCFDRLTTMILLIVTMNICEGIICCSCPESNPGHLTCAASSLPLTYDQWTTTSPHNIYCTSGTEMSQFHTWQPLSMCRQNSETISASEISNSLYFNMRQEFCATMMIYAMTTRILMRRLFSLVAMKNEVWE